MAIDEHDHGLQHDLRTLSTRAQRRQLLQWAAGAGTLSLLGCGTTSSSMGECATIPEETAGPFPGDGSNGANALALSGIVRSDIRASVADASGVAAGVPLTITLTVVNASAGCGSLAGNAVYLWHCDRDGAYSMYAGSAEGENYLRGVQVTDESGSVTFTTIFPGAYSGRWPHMHFEVYPTLASTSSADNKIATSQLALPEAACSQAYAADGYEASVSNIAGSSVEDDNVFSDGAELQLATVSGSVSEGFSATLTIAVEA